MESSLDGPGWLHDEPAQDTRAAQGTASASRKRPSHGQIRDLRSKGRKQDPYPEGGLE